jgi:hypothetical protein
MARTAGDGSGRAAAPEGENGNRRRGPGARGRATPYSTKKRETGRGK